jgi:hypothetical protein
MELVKRITTMIDSLSDTEFREVWNYVVIKSEDMKHGTARKTFREVEKGYKVRVMRKGKELWTGTVEKKLVKNIMVIRDGDWKKYRVPPEMLEVI